MKILLFTQLFILYAFPHTIAFVHSHLLPSSNCHLLSIISLSKLQNNPFSSSSSNSKSSGRGKYSRKQQLFGRSRSNQFPMRRNYENYFTATNLIIFTNIMFFIAGTKMPHLQRSLMKIDYLISRGQSYRLFTSLFLHGGFYHLMMNCYSLHQIGPQAERIFGSTKYVMLYLASGVLANSGTFLAGTSPFSLGASGCTFGLIGAFTAYYYFNRHILGRRSEVALDSIKNTMVMNLFYGYSMKNIDNWAHIGGFISGLLLGYLFGPKLSRVKPLYGGSGSNSNNNILSRWRLGSLRIRPSNSQGMSRSSSDNSYWHRIQESVYMFAHRMGIRSRGSSRDGKSKYKLYGDLIDDD